MAAFGDQSHRGGSRYGRWALLLGVIWMLAGCGDRTDVRPQTDRAGQAEPVNGAASTPLDSRRVGPSDHPRANDSAGSRTSGETVVPEDFSPSQSLDLAAAPPRIRPYTQWTLAETAADALARIGEAAVPELITMLQQADPARRVLACEILGRMGADARLALPALIEKLQDPSPEVRRAAARAIGQMGPEAAAAVPDLIRLLEQEATDQRTDTQP